MGKISVQITLDIDEEEIGRTIKEHGKITITLRQRSGEIIAVVEETGRIIGKGEVRVF